ncbi:c6 zinc finger domain containing protein [Niveomyces insectorum RCEF 264]|uniref:C6 zinc finger domain containing protein n=1 Tax=Niveomyces insectorum RCEF 264 TaxID=1081102 RepID=A0A167SMC7_9HYPO|nr:c6 zinc finger domain containing protein [Niveomyces insectorum RCEF 264]
MSKRELAPSYGLRRVKCDEARPACVRCTSTGRVCDGYKVLLGSGGGGGGGASTPPASLAMIRAPSSCADPLETRSLQFYIERTISQFQLFFPDDFWNSHVLQFALSQDCIRHALVSLSAHHERYLHPERSAGMPSFAFQQHNLAIRSLLAAGDPSKALHVHIVSCLIFICIEALQGELQSAIRLFKHGLSMIKQLHLKAGNGCTPSSSSSSSSALQGQDKIMTAVMAFINRFAVQVVLLDEDTQPEMTIGDEILPTSKLHLTANTRFASLLEARETLLRLARDLLSGKARTPTGRVIAAGQLQWWSSAFDALIRDQADRISKRGVALLELHQGYLALELKMPNPRQQTLGIDQHVESDGGDNTPQFAYLVSCAERAVQPDANEATATATATAPGPQFYMDLGVVPILFSTILRCHDADVRHRALSLLREHRLQEGIWDSTLTLRVAERILSLEASHAPDAPKKVENVAVLMDPDRKSAVVQFELHDSTIEETLDW